MCGILGIINHNLNNLHNENDEYTVEFPPMCDFEKAVILEFTQKLCSDDDEIRLVSIKDLVNIIIPKFNEIVEVDRQQSNPRTMIDRINGIGFTPVPGPEGNPSIYFNPICCYILYINIYNMAKKDGHTNLANIKNLMIEQWSKFLDYYYPNITFEV